MAERGDDYGDLVEAIARGFISDLDAGERPRQRYVVELGTWDAMVTNLLEQVAVDAGSLRAALVSLNTPTRRLVQAWMRGTTSGMSESADWLVAQHSSVKSSRVELTPSIRARRGDDYRDLVDVAGSLAVAGDGELDPACQRRRYVVDRAPWLRMVAGLLAQVVGDAGSIERAAPLLAVPESSLFDWVRWFVSRASIDAARSRWPVAPVGDRVEVLAYVDLLEAVERDAIAGDNELDPPNVRELYAVRLDSWERMEADLLAQIVDDAGSIRRASELIDLPRSTLGARLARARRRSRFGHR